MQNCELCCPGWTQNKIERKFLDFPRELKKTVEHKMTVIKIVIDALGTVTKRLVQGLEDWEISEQVETAFLTSSRILRRVLETWGDLLLLKLQSETIG